MRSITIVTITAAQSHVLDISAFVHSLLLLEHLFVAGVQAVLESDFLTRFGRSVIGSRYCTTRYFNSIGAFLRCVRCLIAEICCNMLSISDVLAVISSVYIFRSCFVVIVDY